MRVLTSLMQRALPEDSTTTFAGTATTLLTGKKKAAGDVSKSGLLGPPTSTAARLWSVPCLRGRHIPTAVSLCRKRTADMVIQTEEEVKRQRLAKLAAWRQQQSAGPIKAEQASSPQPFSVFEDPFAKDEAPKPEPQQAAWYALVLPVGRTSLPAHGCQQQIHEH